MRARTVRAYVPATIVLLSCGVAASASEQLTRAIEATVFIKVDRLFRNQSVPTFGSGFFVDDRGHILTNWHVVAPTLQLTLDGRDTEVATTIDAIHVVVASGRRDERTLVAKTIRLDRERDLALLAVPDRPAAWLDVTAPPSVALTDEVWAVGYPFGDLLALNNANPEVTVTKGHTTSIRHGSGGDVEAFQLDAAINPGNSGGPVLNQGGVVVGVAWAGVRGGTGTALAIAPGRVREFSDEIQFDVRVTPAAIYVRSEPLLVEVRPLLRGVERLQGQVTLTGTGIETTTVQLTAREASMTAQVPIPPPKEGSGTPSSYMLSMRLTDAGGRQVFRHAWTVPLRENELAQVSSGRAASAVMRDRQAFPNQASAEDNTVVSEEEQQRSGKERQGRSALSQLAAGVKLRGSGGQGLVVTNSNLNTVGFVVDETRYAALPAELRPLAIEFDRAEFHLRGATVGIDTARDAESARATMELARAKVTAAKLCRCPDHKWFRPLDFASCERCVTP